MTTSIMRSPEVIASEINTIKDQTRKMVLHNAIEIGRRLCEAKEAVPHGEWGSWLETSVEFKQSTANNLMRIFEEYGADQIALFGETGAKSHALGKLNYTQAVALLAIPAEEREDFIQENDVENMSTRELQKVIKERDEALKSLKDTQEENERLLDDRTAVECDLAMFEQRFLETQENYAKLQEALEKERAQARERANKFENDLTEAKKLLKKAQAAGDKEEVKRLESNLKDTSDQLAESNKRIQELEEQLKAKPIDVPAVVEKIPEAVEAELAELRKKQASAAALEFKLHFNSLVKGFNDLLQSLSEIQNDEQRDKLKGAVAALIGKMNARL